MGCDLVKKKGSQGKPDERRSSGLPWQEKERSREFETLIANHDFDSVPRGRGPSGRGPIGLRAVIGHVLGSRAGNAIRLVSR
jgi:hypothetical protein